ncbi:MAG: PVC-type heme-binding CxxCH protein [Akkermansiaceae bacterium]
MLLTPTFARELRAELNESSGTIEIFEKSKKEALVTQNARSDFRPYLHPILAPDGKGVLTEFSPGHHKHQTGLYWGFTRVNGRDFFHHPGKGYWKKKELKVITASGEEVSWQTSYDLLDKTGNPLLTETQTWNLRADQKEYILDLTWSGEAKQAVTIGRYDYGGLFLRMPYRKGMPAHVVNSSAAVNQRAEGEKAVWLDLGMQVEGRDDLAHITFFDHPGNNGFPQRWRVDRQFGVGPSRARSGDWKFQKGQIQTVRHRLVVHSKKVDQADMTQRWAKYTGNPGNMRALWRLDQEHARKAKFLAPKDALQAMTTQDGFKANLYASEPMITQPMAFCWDDHGRLWIAENRDYETRQRGFANSGDSRILILEDTDRDGVADKRTVFAEKIPFPAGIAVGLDGLWLGAPPNLLFIPDRNRDDKAEMDDIEVRLTGWGIRDRHETLNSFHWGPDGWLYGCQGFATPSRVGKPKGKGQLFKHRDPFPKKIEFEGEPVDINGGVWRYHPTKDRFEVVAHGFSNPWGIDYDAKGNFFITACVIPHMFHVIPGGIYHRQGGRHFNPYVYQDIRTIVDHSHRSAHGGARIYLSDAFPEKHHGNLFMCNLHEHAVLADILTPKGSGFVASHGRDLAHANDAQWVGFSMELGPDGALYALDWHDGDICGKDVLNKDTGRIYRLTPEKSQAEDWPERYDDLRTLSDLDLAKLQLRKSSWHARRARVILQGRAIKKPIAKDALSFLQQTFKSHANPDLRLRAMWTLHVSGSLKEEVLITTLSDADEYLRAWAIEFLNEDKKAPVKAVELFAKMAASDRSPAVRLRLASALQRLPVDSRWPILQGLVSHQKDADDHNIPKMIWFGVEPLVSKFPDKALELAWESKIPLITEFIARRAADANLLAPLVKALRQSSAGLAQQNLLKGMRDGLNGRRGLKAPEGWNAIREKFALAGGEEQRLVAQLSQQFGIKAATRKTLELARNPNAPAPKRKEAIRALASQKEPDLIPLMKTLFLDPAVQIEAIRALTAFNSGDLGKELLQLYPKLPKAAKQEAVQALASRPIYGNQLTTAIRDGSIARKEVPSYVARQLRRVVGNGFLEVWGLIDEKTDKAAEFRKYEKLLTPGKLAKANLKNGRILFQNSCMACHQLHGEGGKLGPNITGANRSSLDYLLHNILDPSGIIQDDYKMVMITTRDGQTLAGNVVTENERQLTLRIVGQEVNLTKSEIQSREIFSVSMMPEGLLRNLSDEETIDLMGYLMKLEAPKK